MLVYVRVSLRVCMHVTSTPVPIPVPVHVLLCTRTHTHPHGYIEEIEGTSIRDSASPCVFSFPLSGTGRSVDALGSLDRNLAIEGILNRAQVEPTAAARDIYVLNVPRSTSCREILSFGSGVGDEAPCRIVRDIQQVKDQDLANKTYYNLFTPNLTQGRDPKGLFRFPAFILNSEAPNYDPTTFPSWCGQSISVSVWGKFTVGGYLLGRYRHSKDPWPIGERSVAQYWSLFVYSDGRGTSMQFALNSTVKSTWDTAQHAPTYKDEINPVLHHVGITVDVIKNEVRLYTDGALDSVVNYDHIDPRLLAKVDCSMDQPMTYIPLAHRPPGFGTPSDTMSDWRLYVGEDNKLSDGDMMTLAYGRNRECKTEVEGRDSLYKDAAGHSCAWYSEMVKIAPMICSNERVRTECPIACGVIVDCYAPRSGGVEVSKNVVWNRIMPITPRVKGENVMCVRAGLDVQESCARANRAWGNAPGELDEVTVKDEAFHRTITRADIDVLDCAQIKRHVDPYCEFSLKNDWGLDFHRKVHASKGLTVSFWIKFSADTHLPANIILYASVYPPRVLARIRFQDNGVIYIRIYSSCGKSENVKPTWTVTHGEWGFVSFIIGASEQGQTGLLGVYNSATSFDPVGIWEWCVPDWPQFLEGIQMPGNMLVSSVEVQNTAVPTKHLLKRYYDEVARYRFRPGPASRRAPSGIQYDRAKKMSSLTLVAPPLVLMRRRTQSSNCSTALGSAYVKSLWQSTVTGVTCQSPYQCDSALLQEPTELLSCSLDEREGNSSFFGKEPLLQRNGSADSAPQFWEFLQSIADASVLVRDQVYFTSNFIDAQTSTVRITMVSFAAEHGIASIFDITANFFQRVSVDYSIRHAQSMEDDDLEEYRSLVIFALLLSSVILIEKIWTFWHLTEHGKNEKRTGLFADIVLQVVLPVIYLSLRLSQKSESREIMLHVMGSNGLTGVKWASTDLSPQAKIASFFEGLMRLEEKMQTESVMSYCYFFLALCTLLRLVKQTDFHPRLAILVGILETAVDDLFHFLLLMCVVMGGFLALAIAQFAGEKDYFSDVARGFETMFNLMMGSVPPNGPNNSEFWMQNSQLMVLTLCYSLLVFFTLLNVIIAIIVIAHQEIYDNVKTLEADNNIIKDLCLTVVQTIKSVLFKWPSHVTLINELEKNRCIMVDYKILRTLAPGWKRKSIISFLKNYEGCSYMTVLPNFRDFLKPSGMSHESYHACDEMEERVAALLRVPTSTLGQRLTAKMRPRVSGVKQASNDGGSKGCRGAGGSVGSSARIAECTRSDAESSSQHMMRSAFEFEGMGSEESRPYMDVTNEVRHLQLVVQGVKEQQDRLEQLLHHLVLHHAPESSKDADGGTGERRVQRGAEDAQVGGELATDERISLVHALGSRCEDVTLSMSPSTLHSPPHIGSISTVEESALTFRGLEPPGLPSHSSARESWQSGARPRTPGGECPRTTFRGKRETVVGGEEVGEVGTKVITVDIT